MLPPLFLCSFALTALPFRQHLKAGRSLGKLPAPCGPPERATLADLGLALEKFVVESVSLPEELQKMLDQRIGMNMIGDMNRYTQFQVAQSMPIAAANEGGGAAGMGAGLGAGMVMAQQMMNAMKPAAQPEAPAPAPSAPAAGGATKFCLNCGKTIPKPARFCPECGGAQQ